MHTQPPPQISICCIYLWQQHIFPTLIDYNYFISFHDCHYSIYLPSYALSQSGLYKVPLNPTRVNALEYINAFPLSPHPEVYGLHENADINRNNKETNAVSTTNVYNSSHDNLWHYIGRGWEVGLS